MAALRDILSRGSLRARLVGFVALAILPTLLARVIFLGCAADTILRDRANRELELRTDGLAASVDHWDHYMVLALASLRDQPDVATMDPARQAPILARTSRVYNDLIMLGVAGPDGVCVARSDSRPPMDYHDREWFVGAMAGRPVSRQTVLSKSTGAPAVAYASPIRDSAGRVVGAAFCTMDERQIAAQVDAGRFGKTGRCFVVDDKGLVIAHPDAGVQALTDLQGLPPVAAVMSTRKEVQGVFADEHGARWLYRAAPLANGWSVIGAQREDEVLAAGRHYSSLLSAVAVLTTVFTLAIAWVGAGRLLGPIRRLTRAAQALSAGDWDQPVPVQGCGELGTLAAAFDQMRRDLQTAYRTVEERVVARTLELSTANRALSDSRCELQQALERLQVAEQEFRQTFELAGVGMAQAGAESLLFTRVNRRLCEMTGYSEQELLGSPFIELTHPDDRPNTRERHCSIVAGERDEYAIEKRYLRKDGSELWVNVTSTLIRDAAGRPLRTIAVIQDVDQRRSAELALRQSEEMLRRVLEGSADCIKTMDLEGRLLWMNDCGRRLMEIDDFKLIARANWAALWPDERRASIDAAVHTARGGGVASFEGFCPTARGTPKWWSVTVSPVLDAQGQPERLVAISRDITARKRAEDALARLAYHDALTGLANRAMFIERLSQCLQGARERRDGRYAVLFLDLDRFKLINDSLGHAAGDRLLTEVAHRLEACVARAPGGSLCNLVARLGGDEFTVLLQDLADEDDAVRVAEQVLAALAVPIGFGGQELFTTGSIGIVSDGGAAGQRYASALDLLRDADAAMYRAKSLGKGQFSIFDATLHDAAVARLKLENDLRRAIERGELLLHYQPIVSLQERTLQGFEALVRWRRDGKIVGPGEFIPVAEDSGLIIQIGTWVLQEACRQMSEWKRRHGPAARDLHVSINVSRRQLADPALVPHVRRALEETQLDPACVKLEITESVIVEDGDAARRVLASLKELGVQLSMDDFGTGYSSLSCLHKFPIDVLKVDRTFVANLEGRRDTAAVIHAIVALAHNLKMKVVAEGLEKPEQIVFLQALDCDAGQGYIFSRPLDPSNAEAWVTGSARPVLAA